MPRTPASNLKEERQWKRQRRNVARLPADGSESNSSSSTNLSAAFLQEAAARPFSDATNRKSVATPSRTIKRVGNRVTPSTNKMQRDEIGASPQPLDTLSSSSSSKSSSSRPKLPAGVVNIYSTKYNTYNADENHNSTVSLTRAYVAAYGKDYYRLLKEREVGTKGNRAPTSSSNASSPTSLAESAATPNRRVVYMESRPALGNDGSVSSTSTTECMPSQPHLTPKMRAILIDWLIELTEEYKLSESTIFCAVALVNAALECGSNEDVFDESLTQSPTSTSTASSGRLIVGRDMLQCLGW
jgi:hypothetical protein